jgi:dTDP-4-dehydrorhamnose reductase
MRVAVIGANGQLGTDLVKIFGKEAIPFLHKDLDVTNPDSFEVLIQKNPEIIINTAAFHKTDACEEAPYETFLVNSVGAKNISEISNKIGAVNVYISTDYVFDGRADVPYTEEDRPNPINIYGTSSEYQVFLESQEQVAKVETLSRL